MRIEKIKVPRMIAAHVEIRRHRTEKLVRLVVATELDVPSVAGPDAPLVARISTEIGISSKIANVEGSEYRFHEGRYWRAVVHDGTPVDTRWLEQRAETAILSRLPKEFDRIHPRFEEANRSGFHASMYASEKDVLRWDREKGAGEDIDPSELLLVDGRLHVACGEPVLSVDHGTCFQELDPFANEWPAIMVPLDMPARHSLAEAVSFVYDRAAGEFSSVETFGGHGFSDFLSLNMPIVWQILLKAVDGIDATDVERTAVPLETAVRCLRDCRRAVDGEIAPVQVATQLFAVMDVLRPILERQDGIELIETFVDIAVRAGILVVPGSEREDASVYSMEF